MTPLFSSWQNSKLNLNVNPVLNTGINGIKTGNTTSGGGNYIYRSIFKGYPVVGFNCRGTELTDALNKLSGFYHHTKNQ